METRNSEVPDAEWRTRCLRAQSAIGFTLIELLLVVVIIMIAAGLAIPSFVRSYRGARLRTSVRTIVMASRYARGTAVLEQRHVAVLFNLETSSIEVVALEAQAGGADQNKFLDEREVEEEEPGGTMTEEASGDNYGVQSRLKKYLADDVKIVSVESENETQEYEGIFWVNYRPNGMCEKYDVRLKDEQNNTADISIDPLSGKAKVEYN